MLADLAVKFGITIVQAAEVLYGDWKTIARPKQLAPEGDWTYWWLRAGRGFGKTISAANWAREKGLESKIQFALVAPTYADGRDTMVEGVTGLLSVFRPHELRGGERRTAWNRSLGELYLANETRYKIFSSEEPDRLRGPQHHYAWLEEISSFKDAHKISTPEAPTTWDNVQLSTRLGDTPQQVITSTPRTNRLTKALLELAPPVMRMVIGTSFENQANLSQAWWDLVIKPLIDTRVGRQEIMAEILSDVVGALWSLAQIELTRVQVAPDLKRIVVAIDPNVSDTEDSDEAGVIVTGKGMNDHGYVLADRTISRGGPRAWAAAAINAYHEFEADLIVAEKNNGGDMVKLTLHNIDPSVPVKLVTASRGKLTRAEPISVLYDGDPEGDSSNPARFHHVGRFAELEEEQTTWVPGQPSPNRMDALVWGATELFVGRARGGTIHVPTGRIPVASGGSDRR